MTGIAEIDIDPDEDACSGDDEDDETDSVIGMYRHLQDQGQTQVQLWLIAYEDSARTQTACL